MRILLKRLIFVVALLIGTSAYAEYRIATVDLNRVFTNYWKTKQAQIVIDGMHQDNEKTRNEMISAFNKSKEEYQKLMDGMNDPAVSATERDRRKKAADDKLKDLKDQDDMLQQFDRGSNTKLMERLKSTRDNIVADIRVVVTAKAKADGYTLVIDSASQSANGTPVILYSVPNDSDITDAVIKQINVGAPVDFPKSDDKPAAKPNDKTAPKLDDKFIK
jgi:outer membrane protein